MDHFPGTFRRLFPYSYLPFILQIPSVCLGQHSLPIQSSSIRPVNCNTSFYQCYTGSHSSSSFPGYSDIKFLSYKCCFLLTLLSGRRSEMHAFSTSDSCLSFSRDKSSVILLTDPAFLAKDQIPGRGSEPIVIPALRHDSSSKVLCPIRVLLLYLQRIHSRRTSSNSRLFIPINKGKQDLSAKIISTWICKTIQLAYSSSSEELLNSMHVKAHNVRAISTSWALFNNASLDEVLSAGFWRTQNSFISHYLQSLSSQAQSLYFLGPLVSTQSCFSSCIFWFRGFSFALDSVFLIYILLRIYDGNVFIVIQLYIFKVK